MPGSKRRDVRPGLPKAEVRRGITVIAITAPLIGFMARAVSPVPPCSTRSQVERPQVSSQRKCPLASQETTAPEAHDPVQPRPREHAFKSGCRQSGCRTGTGGESGTAGD